MPGVSLNFFVIAILTDLPDLTGQFTPRADDRHAIPLGSSGKIFGLTFILPSLLVKFPTLDSIKPQHPPLVCSPANCFKF